MPDPPLAEPCGWPCIRHVVGPTTCRNKQAAACPAPCQALRRPGRAGCYQPVPGRMLPSASARALRTTGRGQTPSPWDTCAPIPDTLAAQFRARSPPRRKPPAPWAPPIHSPSSAVPGRETANPMQDRARPKMCHEGNRATGVQPGPPPGCIQSPRHSQHDQSHLHRGQRT